MKTLPTLPIDAVITWVDGNDPAHQAKLSRYLGTLPLTPVDAQQTRFCSVDEIRYCVLSLLRFAPFFRKLFIVTDGQIPPVFEDVKRLFPERLSSLQIVDHEEVFRGYEQFLPTFSSLSIETMLFRIQDLSEHFIYLNDDLFLVRETRPSDWFVDGVTVLRGRWRRKPTAEIFFRKSADFVMRKILSTRESYVRSSYKLAQWQAARLAGFRGQYFWSNHVPRPMRKSLLQRFYSRNPSALERNAAFRLRNIQQFNPQTLAYHLEILGGNENRKEDSLVCLKAVNRRRGYVERKLKKAEEDGIKFLCAQSLDLAPPKDLKAIQSWLERIIVPGQCL